MLPRTLYSDDDSSLELFVDVHNIFNGAQYADSACIRTPAGGRRQASGIAFKSDM